MWELGAGRVIEGRAAIVDHWRTSIANYRHVVQLYLSSTATIDGDAATGRAYLVELNVPVDGDRRVLAALYDDTYRRTAGGWLFSSRSLTRLYAGAPDLSGQFFGPDLDLIGSPARSVERPRQLVGLTGGEHHPPGRERVPEQVDGRVP